MRRRISCLLSQAAVLTAFGLVFPPCASATTYIIRPDGTGDFPTIQAAVNGGTQDDVIELADGTFTGPGNRDVAIGFNDAHVIRSQSGDPASCIIDCQANATEPHRGFLIMHGLSLPLSAKIERITITHGYGPVSETGDGLVSGGGAILCQTDTILELKSCILFDNEAILGGAIAYFNHSFPKIENCIFAGNRAEHGGAIYANSNDLDASFCTFSANAASVAGGAAHMSSYGSHIFDHCTFSGNSAPRGGGLFASGDLVSVRLGSTIVAFSPQGEAIVCEKGADAGAGCSDIFGNAGGDWVGCVAGGLSEDPQFCSSTPDLDFNWTLQGDSPCAIASCGVMGAWPAGCATAVEPSTWGAIKGRYR